MRLPYKTLLIFKSECIYSPNSFQSRAMSKEEHLWSLCSAPAALPDPAEVETSREHDWDCTPVWKAAGKGQAPYSHSTGLWNSGARNSAACHVQPKSGCSLGLCTHENGEHCCHVTFPSLSSGPWSSSVSLSGLRQPPCMERSCHPIILRRIPIMPTKPGTSRSLWDMAFTSISHIWISNHHRTANMTLWRYYLCSWVRKRQESSLEHRTAKLCTQLRAGRGVMHSLPVLSSKKSKWLVVSPLAAMKSAQVCFITTWVLAANWVSHFCPPSHVSPYS